MPDLGTAKNRTLPDTIRKVDIASLAVIKNNTIHEASHVFNAHDLIHIPHDSPHSKGAIFLTCLSALAKAGRKGSSFIALKNSLDYLSVT